MGSIKLDGLKKAFGSQIVIPDANLEIADGEFVVFVGPSGWKSRRTAAS
jgi:ABC-type sugar transport system ATPase subunit